MKERIRQLMEQLNLNQQEFSKKIRISSASISNILAGRSNPTHNHVSAIHAALPEVNVNWLMFGEGEMFSNSVIADTTDAPRTTEPVQQPAEPNLFAQPAAQTVVPTVVITQQESAQQRAKKNDKQPRRIKEITVHYDDGTYETLKASK